MMQTLAVLKEFAQDLGLLPRDDAKRMEEQAIDREREAHLRRMDRLAHRQATVTQHLGNRGIASTFYRFNPRHSNDTGVYPHFREPMIREIAERSQMDRENNPAHLRHIAYLNTLTNGGV